MCHEIPTVIHVIMLLALCSAVAGLGLGLRYCRRNVDDEVKYELASYGWSVACCVLLVMLVMPVWPIGFEVCGLILCPSIFFGCFGIGLCTVRNSRQ